MFRDVWFGVDKGEFMALIGHSGCGKTTILNILAGLEAPDAGTLVMDGREMSGPSLDRAVIFQSHALPPWLTALGNVASPCAAATGTGRAAGCRTMHGGCWTSWACRMRRCGSPRNCRAA